MLVRTIKEIPKHAEKWCLFCFSGDIYNKTTNGSQNHRKAIKNAPIAEKIIAEGKDTSVKSRSNKDVGKEVMIFGKPKGKKK